MELNVFIGPLVFRGGLVTTEGDWSVLLVSLHFLWLGPTLLAIIHWILLGNGSQHERYALKTCQSPRFFPSSLPKAVPECNPRGP